uniref:Multiple epidermal growth factor-like domains protein 6 n=1 Tax=Crassostrea virginica TaxID=6565 RepID=A0A8B8BT46_CRAVI|nr:multiple epidermal growth factor-like domains protein 6 [Crassostrea virginica]
MRTDAIGVNSHDQTVWWNVDLGRVYNIYSVNIVFKNYEGDGCETSGVYGDSCQKLCPINCRNNTCHIKTGTCFECEPGWKGATCNMISGCVGSYGEDCQYPCSKHCVNQICDRFNGSCLFGCDRGYYEPKCDQEFASPREFVSRLSTVASGILGATVIACLLIATAIVVLIVRRKKLCIFGENITSTTDSPYADIENQPSGESTYQELTESDMNKDYHNLALQ